MPKKRLDTSLFKDSLGRGNKIFLLEEKSKNGVYITSENYEIQLGKRFF